MKEKQWIFVTQLAGAYVSVAPDGEETEHTGLSMYLGVGRGPNPDVAFSRIYGRIGLERIPELGDANIHAFEIVGDGKDVNFQKARKLRDNDGKQVVYNENREICEWCQKDLPTNGAAKFSHLKMHLRQLVEKGKLTEEQAQVRTLKLPPEIRKVFEASFAK